MSFPGYSKIPNPTAEQLADLSDRLASGQLSRCFVHEGTAYYRRARKGEVHSPSLEAWKSALGPTEPVTRTQVEAPISPFRPGPTDPADRRVPRPAPAEPARPILPLQSFYIRLYAGAIAVGALLAIIVHQWKPS